MTWNDFFFQVSKTTDNYQSLTSPQIPQDDLQEQEQEQELNIAKTERCSFIFL